MGDELRRGGPTEAALTGVRWQAMRELVFVGLVTVIAGGLVAVLTGALTPGVGEVRRAAVRR